MARVVAPTLLCVVLVALLSGNAAAVGGGKGRRGGDGFLSTMGAFDLFASNRAGNSEESMRQEELGATRGSTLDSALELTQPGSSLCKGVANILQNECASGGGNVCKRMAEQHNMHCAHTSKRSKGVELGTAVKGKAQVTVKKSVPVLATTTAQAALVNETARWIPASGFVCSSAQIPLEQWFDNRNCDQAAIKKLQTQTQPEPDRCTICATGVSMKFCMQVSNNTEDKSSTEGVPLKFATDVYQCASKCHANPNSLFGPGKRKGKAFPSANTGGSIAAVIGAGSDKVKRGTVHESPTACLLSFVHDTRKIPLASYHDPTTSSSGEELGEDLVRLRRRIRTKAAESSSTVYIGVEFVKVDVCKGGYNYAAAAKTAEAKAAATKTAEAKAAAAKTAEAKAASVVGAPIGGNKVAEDGLEHLELIGEGAGTTSGATPGQTDAVGVHPGGSKAKGKTTHKAADSHGVLSGMHKKPPQPNVVEDAEAQAAFAAFDYHRKQSGMATDSRGFSDMKCAVQKVVLRTYICVDKECDESGATTAMNQAPAPAAELEESEYFAGAATTRRRAFATPSNDDHEVVEASLLGDTNKEPRDEGKSKGKLRKQLAEGFGGETSTLAAMVV